MHRLVLARTGIATFVCEREKATGTSDQCSLGGWVIKVGHNFVTLLLFFITVDNIDIHCLAPMLIAHGSHVALVFTRRVHHLRILFTIHHHITCHSYLPPCPLSIFLVTGSHGHHPQTAGPWREGAIRRCEQKHAAKSIRDIPIPAPC